MKLLKSISEIIFSKFLIIKINNKLDLIATNNIKKNTYFTYNLCLISENKLIVNEEKIKQRPKNLLYLIHHIKIL